MTTSPMNSVIAGPEVSVNETPYPVTSISSTRSRSDLAPGDHQALAVQLEREISCLQRQLDRLRCFESHVDGITCRTYEDMISTRRIKLSELG